MGLGVDQPSSRLYLAAARECPAVGGRWIEIAASPGRDRLQPMTSPLPLPQLPLFSATTLIFFIFFVEMLSRLKENLLHFFISPVSVSFDAEALNSRQM